eukprot:scaffold451_cov121-Cylindrotheca_fusiformis.AAC.11
MDAWTLAMKEEIGTSNAEEEKQYNDVFDLVLSRIDQIETRETQSRHELKRLHERLLKAEEKLAANQKTKFPWRRIGVHSRSVETLEDVGMDEADFCDEFELPKDVYTIISAWRLKSVPFWISLYIVAIQIALLVLLLVDQIDSGAEKSLNVLPANVPTIVHVSQALAILVAIMGQDDLRIAIEGYFDGLPTRFKGDISFQHMNTVQWNFSYGIRFIQGFLSVVASFILALQSETVFDVLLNFLGVKFVSELDDLAFLLGGLGYLGEDTRHACNNISEATFQQDGRNIVVGKRGSRSWMRKYAHVIGVFAVLLSLFAVFILIVVKQNEGAFSVQEIRLDFYDDTTPFLGLFDGCYRASKTGKTYGGRLIYEQVGFEEDGGKFGYCSNIDGEKGWTFFLGENSDPCNDFVARSDPTTTFDLLEAGEKPWYSTDGVPLEYKQVSRVLESSTECSSGGSDAGSASCEELDLEGRSWSISFLKTFVNSTESNILTNAPLSHPIYVGDTSTPESFKLLFYTGRRWVLTETITPNTTFSSNASSMFEYMESGDFQLILGSIMRSSEWVDLVSDTVASTSRQVTPVGHQWYRPRQELAGVPFNVPAEDISRPEDVVFSCSKCDNKTNPCYYGGVCTSDQICDCVNGGSGALCQEIPVGDGVCHPYFNTELYEYDGGDCCGGTCDGPACGLAGLLLPFGLDPNAPAVQSYDPVNFGYASCVDPNMAPLTVELADIEVFDDPVWNVVFGNAAGDPWCSLASVNVMCDGISYLHVHQVVLQNSSDCHRSFVETIQVPFGARCELTTNAACFGPFCLNHNVSVYYGTNTSSDPIQWGSIKNELHLSFGVPSRCLSTVLLELSSSIFDVSTVQGMAAASMSSDGLSEYLCNHDPDLVIERYALSVFNESSQFASTNSGVHQCRGWGVPAVQTVCRNNTIISLNLGIGASTKRGSIPTELALLSNLRKYIRCFHRQSSVSSGAHSLRR